ncbi:MAG TPA: response regulator, partial [Armatimonadota bacterium]
MTNQPIDDMTTPLPEGEDGNSNLDRAQLAHIRHELRTPINAILGYSEILLEDSVGLEEVAFIHTALQTVHAGGKVLLTLINELLDTTRVEMALTQVSAESLSESIRAELHGSLHRLVGQCEILLAEAEAQCCVEYLSDLEKILTAGRTLQRFVDELVDIPVPATASNAPSAEAAMIRQMETPVDSLADQAITALPSGGKLLVVDDVAVNRDLLSRRLEAEGYVVAVACSGLEALEMIVAHPPELVLLDVMMPEMSGLEVLRTLKASALREIPVIMISALDEVDSAARCIEAGAEDYLPKPFDPVLLRAR